MSNGGSIPSNSNSNNPSTGISTVGNTNGGTVNKITAVSISFNESMEIERLMRERGLTRENAIQIYFDARIERKFDSNFSPITEQSSTHVCLPSSVSFFTNIEFDFSG